MNLHPGYRNDGSAVTFSTAGYVEAMKLYRISDIETVTKRLEAGKRVPRRVAEFFRDFAIAQEVNHPDFDRGVGVGSLATRIELALGDVPEDECEAVEGRLAGAQIEYDLAFG